MPKDVGWSYWDCINITIPGMECPLLSLCIQSLIWLYNVHTPFLPLDMAFVCLSMWKPSYGFARNGTTTSQRTIVAPMYVHWTIMTLRAGLSNIPPPSHCEVSKEKCQKASTLGWLVGCMLLVKKGISSCHFMFSSLNCDNVLRLDWA